MTKAVFKIGILSVFLLNFNQAWSKNGVIDNKIGAEQALNYLNGIRQDLKLPILRTNRQLQQSAASHAFYEVLNDQQGHEQTPNYPSFTGQWPIDRAYAAGYASQASEVVSYNAERPEKYIDDLMSAIYHRLGLLDMSKDEVGIGLMEDNQGIVKGALVANLGNQNLNQACQRTYGFAPGTTLYGGLCKNDKRLAQTTVEQLLNQTAQNSPKLLFWPKSGATVPPVFYEESPDPLPQCNVSGYPVHLQINPNYWGKIRFKTETFSLKDLDSGESVEAVTIFNNLTDPQKKEHPNLEERWLAFFPLQRLNWNRRYQAQVQWEENGHLKTTRWAFFTPKLLGLKTITSPKSQLKAHPGETLHLYFPPKSCTAPSHADFQTQYTQNLKFTTQFIDNQTLKLVLGKQTGKMILTYEPTQTQVTIEVR